MKTARPDKSLLKEFECDANWLGWSKQSKNSLCSIHDPKSRPHRKNRATRDTIQNLEINGLKSKVAEMQKLIEMLLVLVDPEDVQAALRLQVTTPSHEEFMEIVDHSEPPDELFGME